jgi:hypothetical protein
MRWVDMKWETDGDEIYDAVNCTRVVRNVKFLLMGSMEFNLYWWVLH